MAPLRDQDTAVEDADDIAVLVAPGGAYGDHACRRPALRFPLVEDLRLAVKRVPGKQWMREADVLPAEVGDGLLADVGHAHAHQHRHRQGARDQWPPELACLGVFHVEVQRMGVHGQQGEPGVVGVRDGPAGAVFVDVTSLEILEVAAEGFAVSLGAERGGNVNHRGPNSLEGGYPLPYSLDCPDN